MEQPLFYKGQKIVCVDSSGRSWKGTDTGIIEGKTYVVSNNWKLHFATSTYGIMVVGIDDCIFRQTRFVPLDTNHQLEEEIFESLKGRKQEFLN